MPKVKIDKESSINYFKDQTEEILLSAKSELVNYAKLFKQLEIGSYF